MDLIAHESILMYCIMETFSFKSVTVFIDACYSGSSRDNETLLAAARPIKIVGEDK